MSTQQPVPDDVNPFDAPVEPVHSETDDDDTT
jgi:hypothetical protein